MEKVNRTPRRKEEFGRGPIDQERGPGRRERCGLQQGGGRAQTGIGGEGRISGPVSRAAGRGAERRAGCVPRGRGAAPARRATARSRTHAPRASTLISRPIFLPLLSLRRSPSRRPRPRRALLPAGSPAAAGPGVRPSSAPRRPHSHPARGPLSPHQNPMLQACDPLKLTMPEDPQ